VIEPGRLLGGRYRIVAFIARGGSGEVYEAEDLQLGVHVALKVLPLGGDPARREVMLRRELQLARQITHPGVCRVFDMRIDSGTSLVSMELLRGESLAERLGRDGPMAPSEAMPIVEQLVAGLTAAHAAGVIHRDLKPHNVMLLGGESRRVVITDFGLARSTDADGVASMTQDVSGSPAYMAPEQVLHQPTSVATDIYALGVTLFEVVTGELPFAGGSPMTVALRRIEHAAPRASTRRRGLDGRWDATIARCLERDPEARFASGAAVLASLRGAPRRSSHRALVGGVIAGGVTILLAIVLLFAIAAPSRPERVPFTPIVRAEHGSVAMAMRLGASGWGMIQRVVTDEHGDLYIVGHLQSSAVIGGRRVVAASSGKVAYAARLTPDGRARWVRLIGQELDSHATWLELAGDRVIVVGSHYGRIDLGGGVSAPATPALTADCWIGALAKDTGEGQWLTPCGATRFGHARRVVIDDGDGLFVIGEISGDARFGGDRVYRVDPSTGTRGWFVAAFTAEGRLRWATISDRAAEQANARGLALAGNHLVFTAALRGQVRFGDVDVVASGGTDAWLGALDRDTGRVRWLRRFGGAGREELASPAVLADGRIVCGGVFNGEIEIIPGERLRSLGLEDAMLVLFDPEGHPIRTWHGGSLGYDGLGEVAVTPAGLVAVGVVGSDASFAGQRVDSAGVADQLLVRVDPDGDRVEVATIATEQSATRSVWWSPAGTLFITGRFRRRMTIGDHTLEAPEHDGFVVELRDLPR
jgi:outer membrane protein assembly factor BamB